MESVGRVLGTEKSTPLLYWVGVAEDQHLQLDDIVAVDRVLPTGEVISIYGVVGQIRAGYEGARFDSDVFLIAEGILPADVFRGSTGSGNSDCAGNICTAALPGTEVRRAVGIERDIALDMTEVKHKLPAGLTRNSQEPVMLDLDFLDGTKGAHVNISGISGVATKTSYATFLLYSLFNSGVLGTASG